jgi:hypothetical protein
MECDDLREHPADDRVAESVANGFDSVKKNSFSFAPCVKSPCDPSLTTSTDSESIVVVAVDLDTVPSRAIGVSVLRDSQFALHFFQGDTFGFGVESGYDEELQEHHGGEEDEGVGAGGMGYERED